MPHQPPPPLLLLVEQNQKKCTLRGTYVIEWNTTNNPADDDGVAHCCAIFHLLGQLINGGLAQGLGCEQRPHPLCGTKDATGHRAGA